MGHIEDGKVRVFPTEKRATLDGGGEDSAVLPYCTKAKGYESGFMDWYAA